MGTALLLGLTILVGGCGGGGGGGGGGDSPTPLTTYKITGKIINPGASSVAFSGAATATVAVDPFGNYSTRLANGSYTVTPTAEPGHMFEPLCQAVSVGGNLNVPDFTAIFSTAPLYKVSGQVKNGSTGFPWMKIKIANADLPGINGSAFTDSNGNYQFAGAPDGRYVISLANPSAYANYLFDRDIFNYLFTVSGANLTAQNFTAVPRGSGSATVDF